mmetsp:Transcript_42101/g.78233  ORF Transcript_42101/g.78233 Transcript_42101/m.78233 type:complete len:182 (-) Transcript_42101:38-583(-)
MPPSALLGQLETGTFAQAASRKGEAKRKPAAESPASGQDLPTDSPVRPGAGSQTVSRPPVDSLAEEYSDVDMGFLAKRIAAGEAAEESLDEAAQLLLQALPAALDPYGFAIPPPTSWLEEKPDKGEAMQSPGSEKAPEGEIGHGVPLRLVARHPDVAWEVDGQLQLLIGAAKRTGDPMDVW